MTYKGYAILVFAAVLSWAVWGQDEFVRLEFNNADFQSIFNVVTPLFVIALFLERSLEVFITARREAGAKKAKARVKSADGKGAVAAAVEALTEYKLATARLAFGTSLITGALLSIAGVRAVWPLLEPTSIIPNATQFSLFNLMDVFITAGLLAGGSDGIHKMISPLMDWFNSKRQ